MRRFFLTYVFVLMAICSFAERIACDAEQRIVGKDTLYFFSGEIQFSSDVEVTWYSAADDRLVQTGSRYFYPDEGSYYAVFPSGKRQYLHAFLLPTQRLEDLTLALGEVGCSQTALSLSGTVPTYTINSPTEGTVVVSPWCYFSYEGVRFDEEERLWTDSLALTDTMTLAVGEYVLPAIYKATELTLVYGIADDVVWDSVSVYLSDPVAIQIHPTSTTTTRGEDKPGPGANEEERPRDEATLTGSAPLDILFETHPTPAADYYRWRIYQGSNLIVDRSDENTRYTFETPGSYRVLCSANNAQCATDSVEFTVHIAESYLRVPNVFTPNGDGLNDEFRVDYRSLREFHCWVYNRWGKLVYEWSDPAKGWDGTIGGRPAAAGAYFYVIRALGTDAVSGYTGKISYKKHQQKDNTMIGVYQLSGDINLLR